jgi:hypothetical protein
VSVVVYRQGQLTVTRDEAGWSIDDGVGCARVADDGVVAIAGDDDVVGVVAAALSARLRGEAFHLHAGVVRVGDVGAEDGVILVAGDSGAGKTTATLALAAAAAVRLVGDDICFLRMVDDVVVARAHRRPLHVGPQTRAMFPALQILSATPTRAGKLTACLPDELGGDAARASPVRGLVFPRIDRNDGSVTTVTPLTPSKTLAHLLRASAMVTWPGLPHAQAHLDVLGRLARLPAVALVMGQDARARPACIVEALRRTAPGFSA